MPPASISTPALPIISSIAPFAEGTSAWLVDIWGVIHNGVRPYLDACAACTRYRERGGLVVLVSNSPRPHDSVMAQLDAIGVPRTTFDAIVTSGDVARTLVSSYAGHPVLHIGPERDLGIFAGLEIARVAPEDADAVVCTGLFNDEHETVDDYTEILAACLKLGLPMICANPDIMVERGGRMIFCAGAIAQAYEAAGRRSRLRRQALSSDLRPDVCDAGGACGPEVPTRRGCSPSGMASRPTSRVPRRRACGRCSWRAACM
ncbi:MAG: hypothetical protein WDN31_09870 [Hyphomicrobium sp.]